MTTGVTGKTYILGRRDTGTQEGAMNIGRYLALDESLGATVQMDALRPHVILVCGKRGYGKSYSMGVIIEELLSLPDDVRSNLASLIIDTMGVFWTLDKENARQADVLGQWNMSSEAFPVRVFTPGTTDSSKQEDGFPFHISTSDLGPEDWCFLFNVDSVSPVGVLITHVIQELLDAGKEFSIQDMTGMIQEDPYADENTKRATLNYLRTIESWNILSTSGTSIHELIEAGTTSILDLSAMQSTNLRAIILAIIAKKIYHERVKARRAHEQQLIGERQENQTQGHIPMTWMFIDEAHIFLPQNASTPATDVLVNEWMRQGRQPGLSMVLATQRPAALHPDVMSQSDIIISHRLTAQDDIDALGTIRPTYMRESIGEAIQKMGKEKGTAIIIDDTTETTHIIKIRPRKSWHGGDDATA